MQVLLADDHSLVRDGLIRFLEHLEAGTTVIEAGDFASALAAARSTPTLDLAILDLYMPGMDGFVGLSTLKREFPALPVVILSGSQSPQDARQAIAMGASGFIPKTMRGASILDVLRIVLTGERYIPPFLLSDGMAQQAQPSPEAGAAPLLAGLTPRELDIMKLIVNGAPNKTIARSLGLQEVTVKAHLRNMFRKLGVRNRTQAAHLAMEAGIAGPH